MPRHHGRHRQLWEHRLPWTLFRAQADLQAIATHWWAKRLLGVVISKFDEVIQPVVLQEVLGSFNLRVLLSFHILCQLAKVDSPL